MAASQMQHRRTHNLLLISKILSCRDNASPFTLVIDSLEQSARPLVHEMIKRAHASKVGIIFVSFETVVKPKDVDHFIDASAIPPQHLSYQIKVEIETYLKDTPRSLIIFDSFNPIYNDSRGSIAQILSGLITPPASLLAVYHSDVPPLTIAPYQPAPLTLLKYLVTAILELSSIAHVLARKSARDRSLAEPVFGLAEETEGVLVGLGSNEPSGLVIEMEYRRKTGRSIKESFFYSRVAAASGKGGQKAIKADGIILLEDHPSFAPPVKAVDEQEMVDTTFNLGLTERQRRERDGVVLPYFDAQREGGGEGGRILYDMGEEDDFDEEEDEI
ncbi:hypothetical protein EJ06DRAFT_551266 [Trichodelitschia bisporula]|uniref:Elongator complex protein 5 n=1 Tax=Trichodelitschia bisporula TaxID=703511 RepID=A0A6G1HN09_9PEZI|nr:hypothetical protein EJ06DRAFT_551266 [Trichodelitschia bisporula]